jgi:sporulation protein YlmC with PRC-barrel domain
MIRMLLTTTALTAMLSGAALAQATAPASPANTMQAPANTMEAPANSMDSSAMTTDRAIIDMNTGYTYADTDNLASRIIGQPVYSGPNAEAENIGDVTDLVLNSEGEVVAAVIGVGGFLGIGQKQVAVDFTELDWVIAHDQTERWTVATTREALEAAPEFQWVEDEAGAVVDGTAPMTPAPTGTAPMAPAAPMTPAAPAAPMAPAAPAPMAPADQPANTMAPANGMAPGNTMAPANGMAPGNTMAPGAEAPANNTMGATDTFDRSTLTEFDELTLTADELEGTAVYGPADDRVGTISDVVLSETGEVDAVIVDVGGFLGMGAKPVAIGFEELNFQTDANNNRYLLIDWTAEQLEAQPEFNADTYTTERDAQRLVRM